MEKETCPKCLWRKKEIGKSCQRCSRINEVNNFSVKKLISIADRDASTSIPIIFHEPLITYHEKNASNFDDLFTSKYFYGKSGTGKTCRAYSIMLEIIRQGEFPGKKRIPCQIISVPDLLHTLRSCINAPKPAYFEAGHRAGATAYKSLEQVTLDHFRDLDWLCLDDFGPEKTTDYASQMLYMIINYRYENMKSTVITSNLTLDQLSAKLEDDRMPSRIMGMCSMMHVAGDDQRGRK